MRFAALLLALTLAPAALADRAPDAKPVDLLTATPVVVAVSSTVANRAILPAHLVDGKLDTAWNSRTGDLVGAWIGARIPVDAHVTAIKLTVGFTRKDKAGDLFTMNPRIKRVRVTRDGKLVVEKALDPEVRTLQEIAIDGPGGEYKIEVVEMVAGQKKSWREISVSELQIWGTLAAGQAVKRSAPVVRVGSFDPPPALTPAECVAAMFPKATGGRIEPDPDADAISGSQVLALGTDLFVCRVEHAAAGSNDTTIDVAAVKRTPHVTPIGRQSYVITKQDGPDPGAGKDGSVQLTAVPLTTAETGLLVDQTEREFGPMSDGGATTSTLYRVSMTALTPILDWKSTWSGGESSDSTRCELVPPKVNASFQTLDLECTTTEGRWHGEDPRGNGEFTTSKTEHYRWKGGRYEAK